MGDPFLLPGMLAVGQWSHSEWGNNASMQYGWQVLGRHAEGITSFLPSGCWQGTQACRQAAGIEVVQSITQAYHSRLHGYVHP